MTFHLKSDRYEKKNFPLLRIVTGICVFIVLIQVVLPTLLPSFFLRIVGPLWAVSSPDDRDQIIAELNTKIDSLEHIVPEPSSELLLGRVLALPPRSTYDTLVINIGSSDGVKNGKKVYAGENILLGTISETLSHSAKVTLFSSPGQTVDVLVGSTSIRSVAYGRGGGQFEVIIPRESGIAVGDAVIIPEIANTIYSRIGVIINDPSRALASAVFKNPIPLQSLTKVHVEK